MFGCAMPGVENVSQEIFSGKIFHLYFVLGPYICHSTLRPSCEWAPVMSALDKEVREDRRPVDIPKIKKYDL